MQGEGTGRFYTSPFPRVFSGVLTTHGYLGLLSLLKDKMRLTEQASVIELHIFFLFRFGEGVIFSLSFFPSFYRLRKQPFSRNDLFVETWRAHAPPPPGDEAYSFRTTTNSSPSQLCLPSRPLFSALMVLDFRSSHPIRHSSAASASCFLESVCLEGLLLK